MTTLGDGLAAPLVRRHAGRLTRSLSENSPSAQPWLWLALAAFLAMALAYMAAVPSFEGFDVQAHYAAVNYYRSERSAPALASETLETSYELITQPPLYYVLAAMAAAGWPVEPAQEYAERSVNAYFGSDVTYRQSVTVPPEHAADAVPALLARLVSLLGGLLVALATWWTARLVLPASPLFAAAAVAVATLNPLFLFQSVTITNDTWAAAVAAIALAIALEGWLGERSPRWWFAAGAALGLCALTKYSALLVAVPSSVAWIMYQRRAGRRLGGAALAWAVAGFGLFGGWWLFRSVMLHGELVPFRTMGAVIQSLYRTRPLTVGQTLGYLPWLVSSFWGVFVALIAPAAYLQVTRWFMVLGLASAPIAVLRARHALSRTAASVNAVLMLWLAVVILGVLHWTRTVNIGEQAARLGLVGASAFGVLMVGGYASWIPARHRPRAYATIFVLMTGLGLWLLPFLYQAYRLPPAVAEGHVPERAVPGSAPACASWGSTSPMVRPWIRRARCR
jgi:4-amino-4-deoxy-L-arabinose transferase-like glycosyltransferase